MNKNVKWKVNETSQTIILLSSSHYTGQSKFHENQTYAIVVAIDSRKWLTLSVLSTETTRIFQ